MKQTSVNDFIYKEIEYNKVVIIGYQNPNVEDLIFPSEINNFKVIGISGKYSFPYLKTIIISEGIEFIENKVFCDCPNLEEVTIPDSLQKLPGNNFIGCPQLSKIHLSKDHPYFMIEDDILYTKDQTTVIKFFPFRPYYGYQVPKEVRYIEPGALYDTGKLTEIYFEEGSQMKEVNPYAFAFTHVKRIYMPSGIEIIHEHAFENSMIERICIPESVNVIEDEAFSNCRQLERIILPQHLEHFGNRVFKDCYQLKGVRLSDGITQLKGTFKNCLLLRELYIPKSVCLIEHCDFKNVTIYSKKGSYVEEYAKKEDIKFNDQSFNENDLYKETIYRSTMSDYQNADVGDIVTFGSGIQRANGKVKDPIEWMVLKKENHQLLLRSKYGFTTTDELFNPQEQSCIIKIVEEAQEGKCTDYNYIRSNLDIHHSLSILVDIKKLETYELSHKKYIKDWLLNHNEYLSTVSEEFIDSMIEHVIIYEKMANVLNDDILIIENGNLLIVDGMANTSKEAQRIIQIINEEYGYLDFDYLKKNSIYIYLHQPILEDGIIDEEDMKVYFGDWYKVMRKKPMNRIIYKINDNVYFADQPLTDKEIEIIKGFRPTEQRHFDVDHNEDGSFHCW